MSLALPWVGGSIHVNVSSSRVVSCPFVPPAWYRHDWLQPHAPSGWREPHVD